MGVSEFGINNEFFFVHQTLYPITRKTKIFDKEYIILGNINYIEPDSRTVMVAT